MWKTGSVGSEFAEATRTWQEEGFAIVPGVVAVDEIDAVASDLALLYGSDTFDDYNRVAGYGDGELRVPSDDLANLLVAVPDYGGPDETAVYFATH